jgi:hypothetical protein
VPLPDSLHLSPSVAAAVERLGWQADQPLLREAAPTAARGHNLVLVVPPAPAYGVPALAGLLSRLGPGARVLLLAPPAQVAEWAATAHEVARGSGLRVEAAQGAARAGRRIRGGEVDPADRGARHRPGAPPPVGPRGRSAHGRGAGLARAVGGCRTAYPPHGRPREGGAARPPGGIAGSRGGADRALRSACADAGRAACRDADARAGGAGAGGRRCLGAPRRLPWPTWSSCSIRPRWWCGAWTATRQGEIERAVGATAPGVTITSGDAPRAALVVAFDPPTPERLAQLASAGEVVLLMPPGTERYLERVAAPRRPLRLPGPARRRDGRGRRPGGRRWSGPSRPAGPRPLSPCWPPLFERYDAGAVAAALYDLWTSAPSAAPAAAPEAPATSKIFVGIGKKDGADRQRPRGGADEGGAGGAHPDRAGGAEGRVRAGGDPGPGGGADRGGAQRHDDPAEAGHRPGGSRTGRILPGPGRPARHS